jgi:sulfur carrier protein
MTLTLNGALVETLDRATLETLLIQYGITPEMRGVAVALNGEVVMKSKWSQMVLNDGDKIEVIRATQGG